MPVHQISPLALVNMNLYTPLNQLKRSLAYTTRSHSLTLSFWVRCVAFQEIVLAWVGADATLCGPTPIRLAFYEYGNFYFENDGSTPKGIDKDLVDELIKRSGCRFTTQVMARARIWADLASGDIDMSVSGIETAERDQFAWFAPYLTMKNYALVSTDIASKVHTGDAFVSQGQYKFGAVRAFKHGEQQDHWLEQLREQQRVEESPNVEALYRKLKDHRIDAIYSQPAIYSRLLTTLNMNSSVVVQDWTPTEKGVPHGLILSKKSFSESDVQQWRNILDTLRRDGTLARIFSRYVSEPEAARMLSH